MGYLIMFLFGMIAGADIVFIMACCLAAHEDDEREGI